jgi:pimeloyl-ACP methyl ester carboxylesterase
MSDYKILEHEDTKYKYIEIGDASKPPLILLHGYAGTALVYLPVMQTLGERYHVFGLDFPMLESKNKIFSLQDLMSYVLDFMNTLGIGKADLMGFSLGGFVASHLAMEVPERVSGVYVVNSSVFMDFTHLQRVMFFLIRRFKNSEKFLEKVSHAFVSPIIRTLFGKSSLSVFASETVSKAPVSTLGTVLNVLDEMHSNGRVSLEKFANTNLPKRVILFKDDTIFPHDRYSKLYSGGPFDLVSLEPGGHCLGEEYMKTLCNHLSGRRECI